MPLQLFDGLGKLAESPRERVADRLHRNWGLCRREPRPNRGGTVLRDDRTSIRLLTFGGP